MPFVVCRVPLTARAVESGAPSRSQSYRRPCSACRVPLLSWGPRSRSSRLEPQIYNHTNCRPIGARDARPVYHERALSLNFQVSFINLNSLLISSSLWEDFDKPAACAPFRQSRGVPFLKRLQLDLALSGVWRLKVDARWPNEHRF